MHGFYLKLTRNKFQNVLNSMPHSRLDEIVIHEFFKYYSMDNSIQYGGVGHNRTRGMKNSQHSECFENSFLNNDESYWPVTANKLRSSWSG